MGQKVNPVGFRVGVTHAWGSRWFAPKKMFGAFLVEDQKIRDVCKKRLAEAGISRILVERYANRVRVTLFSARPGVIIGHKGGDVEAIRAELEKMTKKEVYIEIKEVQGADAPQARHEARDEGRDGHGRRRHQGPRRRPHQRRGNRARRVVPRGQGAAAHAPREHRLRLR